MGLYHSRAKAVEAAFALAMKLGTDVYIVPVEAWELTTDANALIQDGGFLIECMHYTLEKRLPEVAK